MNKSGVPNLFDPKQHRRIDALSLMTLLYHVHRGAALSTVGFEDSTQTIQKLTFNLNQRLIVRISDLESALWSANLMQEQGKWWHPTGRSFDEFLRDALPGARFDKDYNFIKET
jgi:hypothetical protein